MKSDHTNHYEATLGIHTGSFTFARPSIGSWVSYGLGTLNRNLPSFVVIAPQSPYAGGQVWGAIFCPARIRARSWFRGPSRSRTFSAASPRAACRNWSWASVEDERAASGHAQRRPAAGRADQVVRDGFRDASRDARVFDLSGKTMRRCSCTA
jgi:hypothetical protein